MILPYLSKMVCLCLACFFLVHLAAGLVMSLLAPTALRFAERIRPSLAARLLLGLRLMPAAFGVFLVTALCVPSYLRFEPKTANETVGLACLLAAALGAAILGISTARALGAAVRSLRHARRWRHLACEKRLERSSVWVVDGPSPSLALAGVFRSRIFISRQAWNALSPEQLAAALRHERAHQLSRDNLKRFFVRLAPDLLPFVSSFAGLERARERFTEWAADDRAIDGNMRESLSLAEALVRFARIAGPSRQFVLVTSFLADSSDLSRRVDRLLHPLPPCGRSGRWMRHITTGTSLGAAIAFTVFLLQPARLYFAHRLLEAWMR